MIVEQLLSYAINFKISQNTEKKYLSCIETKNVMFHI